MVGNLPSIIDGEVRRNHAPRPFKLSLPAVYLPHHHTLPQTRLWTGPKISLPNGTEAQTMSAFSESNAARLLEATLPGRCHLRSFKTPEEGHLRLEYGLV